MTSRNLSVVTDVPSPRLSTPRSAGPRIHTSRLQHTPHQQSDRVSSPASYASPRAPRLLTPRSDLPPPSPASASAAAAAPASPHIRFMSPRPSTSASPSSWTATAPRRPNTDLTYYPPTLSSSHEVDILTGQPKPDMLPEYKARPFTDDPLCHPSSIKCFPRSRTTNMASILVSPRTPDIQRRREEKERKIREIQVRTFSNYRDFRSETDKLNRKEIEEQRGKLEAEKIEAFMMQDAGISKVRTSRVLPLDFKMNKGDVFNRNDALNRHDPFFAMSPAERTRRSVPYNIINFSSDRFLLEF